MFLDLLLVIFTGLVSAILVFLKLASCCILGVPAPTSEAVCDLSTAHVFGHVSPVRAACVTALNWMPFFF